MVNIIFKEIPKEDKKQTYDLVDNVYGTIENKAFLIPWTKDQLNRFWDKDYSYLYGAYDDNKLVAMMQLFTTKEIEESYYDILNINKEKTICELGGFLVLSSYRKMGIMTNLAKIGYDLSIDLGYDYIICTCHPDNVESNKIVKKLGFILHSVIETESGYLRNVWYKKLK